MDLIDTFTRYGVCMHCEKPIHTVGRSAVHTDNYMYTCEGGFAEFLTTETAEEMFRQGHEEGFNEGYNEAKRELENDEELAHIKGRRELAKELTEWLSIHNRDAAICRTTS